MAGGDGVVHNNLNSSGVGGMVNNHFPGKCYYIKIWFGVEGTKTDC